MNSDKFLIKVSLKNLSKFKFTNKKINIYNFLFNL